ncbi:MAG: hypothetical protein AAFX06_27855 [Planctomycetota bacterium]
MPFKIGNGTYKFEPMSFSGGKERITINGQRLYEGVLTQEQPARFSVSGHDYVIYKEGKAYRIKVTSGDAIVVDGLYNQMGIDLSDPAQAKAANAVGICVAVGVVVGVSFMIIGNITTGVIPGGAIGGGIGGGLGGALGGAVGKSLFAKE